MDWALCPENQTIGVQGQSYVIRVPGHVLYGGVGAISFACTVPASPAVSLVGNDSTVSASALSLIFFMRPLPKK